MQKKQSIHHLLNKMTEDTFNHQFEGHLREYIPAIIDEEEEEEIRPIYSTH